MTAHGLLFGHAHELAGRRRQRASKDGTWRAYSGAATSYIKTYRDDYVDVR